MTSIAVFLYPHRIGVARVNKPGKKPSYSAPMWRQIENMEQLLAEPVLLVSLIKEMVGEEKGGCQVYLNVAPGACKAVMFSYDKKRSSDLKRLRQSELETVFHGEFGSLYTYDLLLDNGKANSAGRSRRVIYTMAKDRVNLLIQTFAAQKMKLMRIAPMDAAAAEAALLFWNPDKKQIAVSLTLDEACTSIAFFQGGVICALRTIPDGFAGVLDTYMEVTGNDLETSLHMLRNNGVIVPTNNLDMPTIQDDVMRLLNRVSLEVVKTLHNTFGDAAVLDQVLICGNFSRTIGLADYLSEMLHTQCTVAGIDTIAEEAVRAVALEDGDFEALLPLAATTNPGADMLWEKRKHRSDLISNIGVCGFLAVAVAGIMAITPYNMHQLETQLEQSRHIMEQPEYVAVQELMDQKVAAGKQKEELLAAIENLPHGATQTAVIIEDLIDLTNDYGRVSNISVDYEAKSIQLTLTMEDYNSFVLWQNYIAEEGRFAFQKPPTFSGSGMVYEVTASMTATDFAAQEAEEEG